MIMPVKRLAVAVMAAFIADAVADAPAHSDEEIKAQFVFAGMCRHAEDIESNYDYAFRMADNDTNRFARVLRELAVENTNQTRRAIRSLGIYATHDSLPFLYSYATNAQYGADALKAVFAIEGVNSNSLAVVQSYLMLTNEAVCIDRGGGRLCARHLSNVRGKKEWMRIAARMRLPWLMRLRLPTIGTITGWTIS